LTLMAYRGIASDMRMSAAVQDVTIVMEQARSRAIRDGKATLVVLRPRITSGGEQIVEAVIGQSSGETFRWRRSVGEPDEEENPRRPATRFVPLLGLEPRGMPEDMGFATPAHQFGDDEMYLMTGQVGVNGEPPGILPAVLYGPDGEVVSYDQDTDAELIFMDFNSDGGQRGWDANTGSTSDWCNHWQAPSFGAPPTCPPDLVDFQEGFMPAGECWVLNMRLSNGLPHPNEVVFDEELPLCARGNDDEPFVVLAAELMIFDDKAAREQYIIGNWSDDKSGAAARGKDLTDFIQDNGRRIRINRYTGVSQRDK
ncbi:MAG: hypothetical protein P8M22_11655, partial [Phycisphaerales bacterium]|nr:hypothetical protein [Phycisphaerales bacterium]